MVAEFTTTYAITTNGPFLVVPLVFSNVYMFIMIVCGFSKKIINYE
jgi:hypothetical protein